MRVLVSVRRTASRRRTDRLPRTPATIVRPSPHLPYPHAWHSGVVGNDDGRIGTPCALHSADGPHQGSSGQSPWDGTLRRPSGAVKKEAYAFCPTPSRLTALGRLVKLFWAWGTRRDPTGCRRPVPVLSQMGGVVLAMTSVMTLGCSQLTGLAQCTCACSGSSCDEACRPPR